jgi:hypothetical protein
MNQRIGQHSPSNICSSNWIYRKNQAGIEINHGGLFEVATQSSSPGLDLDIFLYEDNGDDKWSCGREKPVAYSMNSGSDEQIKIYFPHDGVYWLVVHGYDVPTGEGTFDLQIHSTAGSDLSIAQMPVGAIEANRPVTFTVDYRGQYPVSTPVTLEGLILIGTPAVPGLIEVPVRIRPEILLYPKPVLSAASDWVRMDPVAFTLPVQNLGTAEESVSISVSIPSGINYQVGSASAPGETPVFDPETRLLTWRGTIESGGKAAITFAAASDGAPLPRKADFEVTVLGERSGQKWQSKTTVWRNLYGISIPFIRH